MVSVICLQEGCIMANLLLEQMEQTREMMIRSGVENGLQNANTIRLSRQLDQLMNTYYEEQLLTESVSLKYKEFE